MSYEQEDSLKGIQILRAKLLFLIEKKQGNLADVEVINTNKILNEALAMIA